MFEKPTDKYGIAITSERATIEATGAPPVFCAVERLLCATAECQAIP